MKQATPLALSLCSLLLLGAMAGPSLAQADMVVVHLQDGRELTAHVHQRTDEARLWLAYGTRAVTVIRPITWERIVWATHRGERVDVAQLKALAARAESSQPVAAAQRVVRVPPASDAARQATMAQRAQQALGFTDRVRSVQFDAFLANWDGDVETDGLRLRLFPIGERGRAVVASGTLHVEFVARRQRAFNDAPRSAGSTVGRIGRWTVRVDEANFQNGVATVNLPFQAVHPEFDTDWFSEGLVHVRFSVAGDGSFEQTVDGVRVRPFSPSRDAIQIQSGRRFLPTERTGRGQRSRE